ncbi:MAG: FAD:protein FMN transferase [Aerococcus sp.]|nr:FAD:protein FMN transferase [Aerococcus sp.]
MKRKSWGLFLISTVMILLMTGCQKQEEPKGQEESAETVSGDLTTTPDSRTEQVLYTSVQLQVFNKNKTEAMDKAFDYMEQVQDVFTTNKEGSDVKKINDAAGDHPVQVSDDTIQLVKRGIEIGNESHGLFDITIGAITNLWQIGSDQARVPSNEEIQQALPLVNYKDIVLDETNKTVFLKRKGMRLELGGLSKGYIGGKVVDLLKQNGVTSAIANLGGNVALLGNHPTNKEGWTIGIQDPDKERNQVVGSQVVKGDTAVVTSGIYEQYIEKDGKTYHHIIDPRTGYPLDNNVASVTVFAPNSFAGDSYSTALFMMGIDDGLKFINQKPGYEVVYIDKAHHIYLSDGLKQTFKLTNKEYTIANENN